MDLKNINFLQINANMSCGTTVLFIQPLFAPSKAQAECLNFSTTRNSSPDKYWRNGWNLYCGVAGCPSMHDANVAFQICSFVTRLKTFGSKLVAN